MTKIIILMKSAPKWFLPQPVFIHHHLKITKMWLLCNEEFRWLFLDGIMKMKKYGLVDWGNSGDLGAAD